jgi:membrane-bound ClpP family serine protease
MPAGLVLSMAARIFIGLMDLLLVIGLITLGLAFIFIELFLIPGTAFVGILGFVVVLGGVYMGYSQLGASTGNIVMVLTLASLVGLLVVGLRRIASLRWADKETIDSRAGELEYPTVKPGDEGVTFNALRPNGTARINGQRVEVFSIGEFIDPETPVVVTKVTTNRIYVKPKNES